MLKNILPIIVGTVLSILIWNFLISEFIDRNPLRYSDQILGPRAKPHELYVSSSEGYARLRMDQYGFNNDDQPVKENNHNIIFLGDSFTASSELARVRSFPSLVNEELKRHGFNYSAFNLGVSGSSMADYLYYSKGYLDTFSPGLVVIQFNETDFIPDDSRQMENSVIETAQGNFEIKHVPKNGDDWVTKLAHYAGWMHPIAMRLIEHIALSKQGVTENGTIPVSYQPTLDNLTLTREDVEPTIRWQMQELKKAYGDKLILFYLSDLPIMEEGHLRIEDTPNAKLQREVIFQVAAEEHITVVDSEKSFLEFYQKTGQLPRGFQNLQPGRGHLNDHGQRLVSYLLTNAIIERLIHN